MKTQIIQIESFDDHISIRDKMNWSKTPRILLVFPARRRVRLSHLDLRMIQRHAESLGAQLGLVSHSLRIRATAAGLGIPVFGSTLAAQQNVWPPHQAAPRASRRAARRDLRAEQQQMRPPPPVWRSHPLARVFFFTLGVAAVLAVALAFLPRAQVSLSLNTQEQILNIPVRASAAVSDVFLSGSVPARTISVTLSDTRSIPASGQVSIPAQPASGEVVFRNLTELAVLVPAGTVVSTGGEAPIRFETLEDGVVDGGVDATATVPVRALAFGSESNLDPNMLQAIEGELSLWLAVTNPAPLTGGQDAAVAAPTASDRENLQEVMLYAFQKEAAAQIADELEAGALLFPQTISDVDILETQYDPPAGQPADDLTLTMRVAYSAQYAAAADLRELARSALAASLPLGASPVAGTLTFEALSPPETSSLGTTNWQMRVTQTLRPNINRAQIAALVQGHSPQAAVRRLQENLPLSAAPLVSVTPAWWPWLPVAPFRIDVQAR